MMRKFWKWLRSWWDSTDPTTDVKLGAYAAVVVAAIVWLSLERGDRGITPAWVDAFTWLCALVGLGGAGWAAVEKWGEKRAQDAKAKGTQDQEGGRP